MNDNVFMGTILLFAFDFVPVGWMACEGQILEIRNHQALYSLITTRYGGDGQTTFALPNLKDASPLPAMKYYIAIEGIYPPRPQ